VRRIRIEDRVGDDPYLLGRFEEVPDEGGDTEVEALVAHVQRYSGA